jgi:proteasome accessory factor C
LLYVIPRASTKSGVGLSEVALELGVDEATVLADLGEVQDRDLYHSSGGADDLQITIEPDRIRVWSTHDLSRPTKLNAAEALALWIGLEIVRTSDLDDGDDGGDLRDRLRLHLVQLAEDARDLKLASAFVVPADDLHGGSVRRALSEAAADHHVCTLRYLKPASTRPSPRRVHPYAIVHAEGAWYALAHCENANEVRAFRLDRVLEVEIQPDRFERPADFDPAAHLDAESGRVLVPTPATVAVVRYSTAIARWIAEREEGERTEDGAFLVRRPVADADWLVRHVLQYAGEAEVLEPPDLRALVANVAERIAARS